MTAIDRKICAIHRPNFALRIELGHSHQARVSQFHFSICIFMKQIKNPFGLSSQVKIQEQIAALDQFHSGNGAIQMIRQFHQDRITSHKWRVKFKFRHAPFMERVILVQRSQQYARVSDSFHGALSIVGRLVAGYFCLWPDPYWCETPRASRKTQIDASAAFGRQRRTDRVLPASECIWTDPGRAVLRERRSPKSMKVVHELKMALSYKCVIHFKIVAGDRQVEIAEVKV